MKWKKEEFQDKDAVPEVTDSLCLIPSLKNFFLKISGYYLRISQIFIWCRWDMSRSYHFVP